MVPVPQQQSRILSFQLFTVSFNKIFASSGGVVYCPFIERLLTETEDSKID